MLFYFLGRGIELVFAWFADGRIVHTGEEAGQPQQLLGKGLTQHTVMGLVQPAAQPTIEPGLDAGMVARPIAGEGILAVMLHAGLYRELLTAS